MYSLIVDDETDGQNEKIWNVYYELYMDQESLDLLQSQAKKLYELSSSLEEWDEGQYGKILRFSDSTTLAMIRSVWLSYLGEDSEGQRKKNSSSVLSGRLQRAIEMRDKIICGKSPYAGVLQFAPMEWEAFKDLHKLTGRFWETKPSNMQANPSLVLAQMDSANIHYTTEILLSFHLSVVYAPLAEGPSQETRTPEETHARIVGTAKSQFTSWCRSFRLAVEADRVTVRFCVSDALVFCYTLQHLAISNDKCANWPRHSHCAEPLALNHPDYTVTKTAPRCFDVIDTSNISDRLGLLNVLVATTPLLRRGKCSTLYTELFVKHNGAFEELLDSLMGGNATTMVILLGLFPVGYWTNTTTISDGFEQLLKGQISGQAFIRQAWKLNPLQDRRVTKKIQYDEIGLAKVLFMCYQKLFKHEDMGSLLGQVVAGQVPVADYHSLPKYHRGNFAAMLKFIRGRVEVRDWRTVVIQLIHEINADTELVVSQNYLQEFYLYLHMYRVHSTEAFRPGLIKHTLQRYNDFRDWKSIPNIVSVTLRVPRSKLHAFTNSEAVMNNVTPLVDGFVGPGAASWQNLFAAVNMCFGVAKTVHGRINDDYKVTIDYDPKGWNGKSDLFISFWVPTWTLAEDGATTRIGACLQSTLGASFYAKSLGFDLKLHECRLGDNDVFITKERPNRGRQQIIHSSVSHESFANPEGEKSLVSLKANLNGKCGCVTDFVARVDITERIESIPETVTVELEQVSPCFVLAVIEDMEYDLELPAPVMSPKKVQQTWSNTSRWVGITLPTTDEPHIQFPEFMFPVYADDGKPVVSNIPYIVVDKLPVLGRERIGKLQWLNSHVSQMFSARERNIREEELPSNARVDFKGSLFTMYMSFAGIQEAQLSHAFGIDSGQPFGIDTLIFVSSARLDVSNRTVVLDAAVIPLAPKVIEELTPMFGYLKDNLLRMQVGKAEKGIWEEAIPAFVERCREWEHLPGCEYEKGCQSPDITDEGLTLLCSCGRGILPPDFIQDVPHWDVAAKYAVRAAISPTFPVPLVEKLYPKNNNIVRTNAGNISRPSATTSGPKAPKVDTKCRNCGKGSENLRDCPGCEAAKYCSRSCQRANWKNSHKKTCGK